MDNMTKTGDHKVNAMVSYKNNSLYIGDGYKETLHYDHWFEHFHPYTPSYPTVINNSIIVKPNPTEAAFKIVTKLIEEKFVKNITVAQFTEMVTIIAQTLA